MPSRQSLIIGIVSAVVLLWSPKPDEPAERNVAAASVAPQPGSRKIHLRRSAPKPADDSICPTTSNPSVMHVDIEATPAGLGCDYGCERQTADGQDARSQ